MNWNQQITSDMIAIKPMLYNYVMASNKRAIRLLKHCGFNVSKPKPVYHAGVEFCLFSKGV